MPDSPKSPFGKVGYINNSVQNLHTFKTNWEACWDIFSTYSDAFSVKIPSLKWVSVKLVVHYSNQMLKKAQFKNGSG